MKNRCYCTIGNNSRELFLCERHAGNITVKKTDPEDVDPNAAFVTALSPNKTFFLNVEVPFKSVSKAERVMDSVLDAQLPFSVDKSRYVFRKSVHTALSGAHKFNVFGVLENVFDGFLDQFDFSENLTAVGHAGVLVWDEIIHRKSYSPNEICFVYFENDGQGCLLYGFNNGLEACYSIPCESLDRLVRTVKTIKAKYQVQFDMASDIKWVVLTSEISHTFLTELKSISDSMQYKEDDIDEADFIIRGAARQFFRKKLFNLLEGEEYISQKVQEDAWAFWLRSGTVLSCISIVLIIASIAFVKTAESKLVQTDNEINMLASEIAGYNVSAAMKGDTVYRSVAQAIKKRKNMLQVFSINSPENMEDLWNVLGQYQPDGELEVNKIEIFGNMIKADVTITNQDALNVLNDKLKSQGYIISVEEQKDHNDRISCRLEIRRGESDE